MGEACLEWLPCVNIAGIRILRGTADRLMTSKDVCVLTLRRRLRDVAHWWCQGEYRVSFTELSERTVDSRWGRMRVRSGVSVALFGRDDILWIGH